MLVCGGMEQNEMIGDDDDDDDDDGEIFLAVFGGCNILSKKVEFQNKRQEQKGDPENHDSSPLFLLSFFNLCFLPSCLLFLPTLP
jgi:hypothetical protein